MRKSHFNDEFLVLLGPIISMHVQMRKINKPETTKGACSSPISMAPLLGTEPIGLVTMSNFVLKNLVMTKVILS
jgi:hypothetical protein